ncbi:MAG: hypothetical protein PHX61_07200 [Alphaproteobacteria bacterium]|nr:hypothetical protein [Alphaproteobacteria bacterium]
MFSYVDQSPLMVSDPTGKNPLLILVGVGAYLFGDVTPANAPSSEDVTQPRVTETKHVTDAMLAIIGAKGLSSGYSSLFSPVQSVIPKTGAQCPEPQSLMDQMVLDAAKRGEGSKIPIELRDVRYQGMDKMSYSVKSLGGKTSEVHYVRDPVTGKLMDFKFKINAE